MGGGLGFNSGSEEFLELVLGEGGELVVSNGEGVGWVSVDHGILGVLGGEDVKSEFVLLLGSVGESMGSEVLNEALLGLGGDGGGVVTHVDSEESHGGAEVVHLLDKFKINYNFE